MSSEHTICLCIAYWHDCYLFYNHYETHAVDAMGYNEAVPFAHTSADTDAVLS